MATNQWMIWINTSNLENQLKQTDKKKNSFEIKILVFLYPKSVTEFQLELKELRTMFKTMSPT